MLIDINLYQLACTTKPTATPLQIVSYNEDVLRERNIATALKTV